MARNEEKAQSMLNRYVTMKNDEKRKPKERRPYLASQCCNAAEAEKWRQQIIKEISCKMTDIQNDGLGERRIRDLNDEINKLIREKWHWEKRIVELGGQDYIRGKFVDGRGPGYIYVGAAKRLPGVRELFEKKPETIIGPSCEGFVAQSLHEQEEQEDIVEHAAKKQKYVSPAPRADVNDIVKRMVEENEKKKHYLLTKKASDNLEEDDDDDDDDEDDEDED
ncbi:NineTeen Complex (NTC) component [Ranunculus cassubicifolius]